MHTFGGHQVRDRIERVFKALEDALATAARKYYKTREPMEAVIDRNSGNMVMFVVKEVVGLSPGIDILAHGDVIVEVDRHPTPHVADYRKALAPLKDGEVAWLFVYRPRPEGTFLAKVEVEKRPAKKPVEKKAADARR